MPNPFTHHPEQLGETYSSHFMHALTYSGRLFAAGFAALAHAFLPFLFEKTASNAVKNMYADMTSRGATAPLEQPTPSSAPKMQAAE